MELQKHRPGAVLSSLGKKLNAYILLESMIAMIVVMLCFGASVMIYNNIVSGSRNKLEILAGVRLENEAIRSKTEKRFLDETVVYEEFRIEKRVLPFKGSEELYRLQYTAITPDGKKIAEYNAFIRNP